MADTTQEPKTDEKCQSCGKNDATELHTCPYKSEINDDETSLCNCCEGCCYDCAMDI